MAEYAPVSPLSSHVLLLHRLLDAESRLTVRAAAGIYHAIRIRITRRGYEVLDERDGGRPISSGRHQSKERRLWLDAVVLRGRFGDRGVGLQSGLGLGRPPGSATAVRTRQALGDFGRPSQYNSTP